MDASGAREAHEKGGRSARGRAVKRGRQRLILDLIARQTVGSQQQLVDLLGAHGVQVTQATASRDIAELGLVKLTHQGRPVYASAADLGVPGRRGDDARLRRVLADYPVRIGRSGLTLLLVSEAGTAGAIGQAIDESTLHEQEGTLAGDNTTLVLFADEARLLAWLGRFEALRAAGRPVAGRSGSARPVAGARRPEGRSTTGESSGRGAR